MKRKYDWLNLVRKNTMALLISGCVLIITAMSVSFEPDQNPVDKLYVNELRDTKEKLKSLRNGLEKRYKLQVLKTQFKEARLSYKRTSVLIDFFNAHDAKKINGAPIDRVEDDNPDKILHPQGLQVIEALLFGGIWNKELAYQTKSEVEKSIVLIEKLENEPDRPLKFRKELVFTAMQMALIRIITTGIAGIDSPVAMYSLPECGATLEGIEALMNIFRTEAEKQNQNEVKSCYKLLASARKYLSTHNDFNSFNRLEFIENYGNPLYRSIRELSAKLGLDKNLGAQPLNSTTRNIFDGDAFNINYFSPNANYLVTNDRIELGRKLFYDPVLSGTKNRSCASCHKPEKAFTDGLKTAVGIDNNTFLKRNTPTLWNSALQTKQFYDSRTSMLENQLHAVVHSSEEMGGSLKEAVKDLKQKPEYVVLFSRAYPNLQDTISPFTIANAISSYIRSLIALDSRFDQYMRGDKAKLDSREKNGFNLFMGKAKCGTCHFMPLFNGLVPPEFSETESEVIGVPQNNDKAKAVLDADEGKYMFTHSVVHRHAFKTPTLRNIELTAPYMHNGVYDNLEEVMNFYNKGGGKGLGIAPENQTLPFDKLQLSKNEISDVIAFLKTLTDSTSRIGTR